MSIRVFIRLAASALALWLAPAVFAAINSQIVWEVSSDNVNWSPTITIAPGTNVLIRARISYTGTGTPVPIALGAVTMQPTLRIVSGVMADQGDTFTMMFNNGVGGNSTNPIGTFSNSQAVADRNKVGRYLPWGRVNLSAADAIAVHHDAVGLFRISMLSQNQPISSITSDPNGDGVGAIPFGQAYQSGRSSADPPFISGRTNITLFRYGYTPSAALGSRVLIAGSPVEGMGQRSGTERQVYWYAETDGGNGTIRGGASISEATITVQSSTPCCAADFNCSGTATVQDVFDFLAAYFNGQPEADVNHAGGLTVQDVFDFLAAYFTGC